MATPAQIAANQANARKSTGPRTDAGKQVIRKNAIRHGLCTFITCLDTEDPEEADRLLADLMDEHQPQGATEQILVNKMAEQFWLQKRAAYYLAQHTDYNEGASEDEEAVCMKQMALYLRYYSTAERAFNRNLHDLRKLQKDRREREAESHQHTPVGEIGFVPQNAECPAAQESESAPQPTTAPKNHTASNETLAGLGFDESDVAATPGVSAAEQKRAA